MEMIPIGYPETSVSNYKTTPPNVPEDLKALTTPWRTPVILQVVKLSLCWIETQLCRRMTKWQQSSTYSRPRH
jgi:hypothetical protein